jgi:hypothetical protein
MGIRIGGHVGPVSVSTSGRGIGRGCLVGLLGLAALGVFALLAWISPNLGAVACVLVPVFFVVQFIVALIVQRRRRKH